MIAQAVEKLCQSVAQRPAVARGGTVWTYDQLAAAGAQAAARLARLRGKNVGVCAADVPFQLATFLALDRIAATAVLFSPSTTADALNGAVETLSLADVIRDDLPGTDPSTFDPESTAPAAKNDSQDSRGRVVLFTSGTSGRPKPALHTWQSLSKGVSYQDRHGGKNWLLSYDLSRFAGLQVMLQCLLTGGKLCVPASRDPEAVVRCLVDDQVQCASATPTFWRMVLGGTSPEQWARCAIEQITLGGEAADQGGLDALKIAFPAARVCQIYASTEMGACFTVRDGQAGFPTSYLSDDTLPCQLRVADDGELWIRSARAMDGYLDAQDDSHDEWFATGDLVRVQGDRIFFLGRKGECINVGGAKVYPADVEQVILTVPGVRHVVVRGMESSLVGELVAADVQPAENVNEADLRKEILAVCRRQLAKFQVPAEITFSRELAVNESGKLARIES